MALTTRYRNLQDFIEALEGERRKILVFSRELPLCLELITQVIEIRRREMAGDDYFGEVPALEEFIPLKPSSSSSKPDWLRSVQLWAPAVSAETSPAESSKPTKPVAKMGGAFRRFEKEKLCRPPSVRKQRRCWSPELHRKFLCALERLGGSQSATPKQIRELMKVERLTNDEVKSHLQKYRLHTTRLSTISSTSQTTTLPLL